MAAATLPAARPGLPGVPDHFDSPVDRAEFRRPAGLDGVELYRARILRHQFDPHLHDGYGLGVVEAGAQRFRYRGRVHLAGAGALVMMQPGELHTGGPAAPEGWSYRMLYLDEAALHSRLGDPRPWDFKRPVHQEPSRAAALSRALARLWRAADAAEALAADAALADALNLLAPLAGRRAGGAGDGGRAGSEAAFRRVVDALHADLAREWRLDELAGLVGLSPCHFQRAFKARHGVSAHQWRMALRLAEAKRLLACGMPPAEAAAAVGLADQAHLTRRLAGMYGITPARYQRELHAACR